MFRLILLCLLIVRTKSLGVEAPEQRFARADHNNNRILTFDEFLHLDGAFADGKREEFMSIDTDRNGKISRAEYDAHFDKHEKHSDNLRSQYFGQIFQEFDQNRDQVLSEDEVRNLLAIRFLVRPRENFPKLFYKFDVDHSRGLNLFEYMKFDAEFPFDQADPISNDEKNKPEVSFQVDIHADEFVTPPVDFMIGKRK